MKRKFYPKTVRLLYAFRSARICNTAAILHVIPEDFWTAKIINWPEKRFRFFSDMNIGICFSWETSFLQSIYITSIHLKWSDFWKKAQRSIILLIWSIWTNTSLCPASMYSHFPIIRTGSKFTAQIRQAASSHAGRTILHMYPAISNNWLQMQAAETIPSISPLSNIPSWKKRGFAWNGL